MRIGVPGRSGMQPIAQGIAPAAVVNSASKPSSVVLSRVKARGCARYAQRFSKRPARGAAHLPIRASFLVRTHQARIARHIGGEDRGKTAGRGHGSEAYPAPAIDASDDTLATRAVRSSRDLLRYPRDDSAPAFDLLPRRGREERGAGQAACFGRLVDSGEEPGVDRQIGFGRAPRVEQ